MVLLLTTDHILAALETVPASRREQYNLPPKLDANGPIAHEQLIRLSKYLQSNPEPESKDTSSPASSSNPYTLNSLLRGTKVYVPPPPPKPEPTPEYLASKATLQAQADQIAYNLLLNPTAKQTPEHHDPYNTISPSNPNGIDDTDTLTPSLVINIFLSVVITGFSVYWALTKFATPDILYEGFAAWTAGGAGSGSRSGSSGGGERQGISEAVRVLLAFFAALAVAVAEAFLYAAYSGKVERAKVKERGLRERKVFVGRVGSDGGDGDGEGNSREGVEGDSVTVGGDGDGKEEIWGKGVNGGVRRRVREKWEKERDGVAE